MTLQERCTKAEKAELVGAVFFNNCDNPTPFPERGHEYPSVPATALLQLCHKYLLSTYYVPGIILKAEDTAWVEEQKPCPD